MFFRLLLADDSITIQKVVDLILAGENCEIRSAGTGEEALAILESYMPDIILADADLPGVSGYDLCKRIKQDPATGNIPVILLSGAFEPLDADRFRQVRADDHLIKPFESYELIQKINIALEAKSVPVQSGNLAAGEPAATGDLQGAEEPLNSEEPAAAQVASLPAFGEGEGAGTEELSSISEQIEEAASVFETAQESPQAGIKPAEKSATFPAAELPSKDEIRELLERLMREKISSILSSDDVKETLTASLTTFMKDSVDKILWDLTPELVERMIKEILKGSIESLTVEVRKVIYETVPELAETMISREIERIRSEF